MILSVKIRKQMKEGLLEASFAIPDETSRNLSILCDPDPRRLALFYCIAGLTDPDEGSVTLQDTVFVDTLTHKKLPPEKRRVGLLTSRTALFHHLSVQDNVRLALQSAEKAGLALSGVKNPVENLLPDVLHDFGLDGLGGQMPGQLSKVQQVRALCARMMAANPRLVLLDDPVAGLDAQSQASILTGLRTVCGKKKIPIVFASADAEEAYAMSDRILVMEDGRTGPVQERNHLFEKPKTLTGALMTGVTNVTPVEVLSKTHVLAPAWGIVVCKRDADGAFVPLPEGICAIGIRPEDLSFEKPEGASVEIPVRDPKVEETPKALVLSFQPGGKESERLCLSVPKGSKTKEELLSVSSVYVPAESLLYLTKADRS